jgi:transaldolase
MEGLKIKLFADGANLTDMLRLQEEGLVQGFTTNPTLMRKAGVVDYTAFSREVLRLIVMNQSLLRCLPTSSMKCIGRR